MRAQFKIGTHRTISGHPGMHLAESKRMPHSDYTMLSETFYSRGKFYSFSSYFLTPFFLSVPMFRHDVEMWGEI